MVATLLVIYLSLLCYASWIDLRTLTIPARITLYGTALGLIAVVFSGGGVLPEYQGEPLVFSTGIQSFGQRDIHGAIGLCVGFVAILVWLLASVHEPVSLRRGCKRALRIWFRHAGRNVRVPELWVSFGLVFWFSFTIWIWRGPAWDYLFSALIGCAFGILSFWAFRLFAQLAAGEEALGFGDVHLQGMIGAWSGWQICLSNAAIGACISVGPVLALAAWQTLRGRSMREIPFGPSLALGAVVAHFAWPIFQPLYSASMETAEGFGMKSLAFALAIGLLLFALLRALLWLRH